MKCFAKCAFAPLISKAENKKNMCKGCWELGMSYNFPNTYNVLGTSHIFHNLIIIRVLIIHTLQRTRIKSKILKNLAQSYPSKKNIYIKAMIWTLICLETHNKNSNNKTMTTTQQFSLGIWHIHDSASMTNN